MFRRRRPFPTLQGMIPAPFASPRSRATRVGLTAVAALATFGACDAAPPEGDPAPADAAPATAAPLPVQHFERRLVFAREQGDSLIAVAWLLDAASTDEGVDRRARGLLLRSGEWEPFLDERWAGGPTRVPWRILPRGPMRLVVGEDESLQRLVFTQPPRELEVALGSPEADWTARGGELLRIVEGGLTLGGARVDGRVLDLTRTAEPDRRPSGDWALLVSGDSLLVVLHQVAGDPPGGDGNLHQGWARLDFRDLTRPDLRVVWEETRSFERARRDVPSRWRVDDPGGVLQGTFEVRSSWLEAGQGAGPQLPVDALFEVAGTLEIEGVPYPVRGLVRHIQE